MNIQNQDKDQEWDLFLRLHEIYPKQEEEVKRLKTKGISAASDVSGSSLKVEFSSSREASLVSFGTERIGPYWLFV